MKTILWERTYIHIRSVINSLRDSQKIILYPQSQSKQFRIFLEGKSDVYILVLFMQ